MKSLRYVFIIPRIFFLCKDSSHLKEKWSNISLLHFLVDILINFVCFWIISSVSSTMQVKILSFFP